MRYARYPKCFQHEPSFVWNSYPLHFHGEITHSADICRREKLAIPVLLGMTFIDKYLKSGHTAKSKIVPHDSPQVPIQMVHEAKIDVEKETLDICQIIDQDPALSVTSINGETKYIKVA